nr:Chain B, 10-mer peptide from Myosin-I binding protein Acan125 [synthetic construct]
RPKPVPPPRG